MRTYFGSFRNIENPGTVSILMNVKAYSRAHGLFRHYLNLILADSGIFITLAYQVSHFSRIFRYIHKVKHIEACLTIFGHITIDLGIFRILPLPA